MLHRDGVVFRTNHGSYSGINASRPCAELVTKGRVLYQHKRLFEYRSRCQNGSPDANKDTEKPGFDCPVVSALHNCYFLVHNI